jgi:hypothetical protein
MIRHIWRIRCDRAAGTIKVLVAKNGAWSQEGRSDLACLTEL